MLKNLLARCTSVTSVVLWHRSGGEEGFAGDEGYDKMEDDVAT